MSNAIKKSHLVDLMYSIKNDFFPIFIVYLLIFFRCFEKNTIRCLPTYFCKSNKKIIEEDIVYLLHLVYFFHVDNKDMNEYKIFRNPQKSNKIILISNFKVDVFFAYFAFRFISYFDQNYFFLFILFDSALKDIIYYEFYYTYNFFPFDEMNGNICVLHIYWKTLSVYNCILGCM